MPSDLTPSEAVARLKRKAASDGLDLACAHCLDRGQKKLPDVLIISLATPMDDTGCMFLVPVAGRGPSPRRAAFAQWYLRLPRPGPQRAARVVDVLFTSAMSAEGNPGYPGRHLFTDVLHDRELKVFCRAREKSEYEVTARFSQMQFARMTGYDAAIDPELARLAGATLFAGARIRLNGGDGVIAGTECAMAPGQPSLSVIADMFPMAPGWCSRCRRVMDRHNLTLAIPLAAVALPETLLTRAAELAASTPVAEHGKLIATELGLAAAMSAGVFQLADPGPAPAETGQRRDFCGNVAEHGTVLI